MRPPARWGKPPPLGEQGVNAMIRLFAAVVLPADVAVALTRAQQGLPGARWRPVEAFHVTLRFFGEMDAARADDLDAELGQAPWPAPAHSTRAASPAPSGRGSRPAPRWSSSPAAAKSPPAAPASRPNGAHIART
jgi:hypothetical protein